MPGLGDRIRPELLIPILVGAIGLTGIVLLHDIPVRHRIEDDLLGRSTIALNAAGLPQAQVELTGRDAVISGVPVADARRARDVVLAVRGVRVARVVTAAAAATPGTPDETPGPQLAPSGQPRDQRPVSLTFDGGTVTVTGWVGSQQQKDELVAALRASGRWTVIDQTAVDPAFAAATAPAVGELVDVSQAVWAPADGVIVRYVHGAAVTRGTVRSAADERMILNAVGRSVVAGRDVEDHLDVKPDKGEVTRQLAALPRITFLSGSAQLTPAGAEAVAKAAAILKAAGSPKVRIDGHTDSSGSAALNLRISTQRADAVRARLIKLEVGGKLTTKGYGESKPLVKERTAADAARNRRVQFTLL